MNDFISLKMSEMDTFLNFIICKVKLKIHIYSSSPCVVMS